MKYLLIALLLIGCSSRSNHTYTEKYLDVTKLPECPSSVVRSTELGLIEYITFTADNGDVLFVAIKGEYKCLKRKVKPGRGPQKRPKANK